MHTFLTCMYLNSAIKVNLNPFHPISPSSPSLLSTQQCQPQVPREAIPTFPRVSLHHHPSSSFPTTPSFSHNSFSLQGLKPSRCLLKKRRNSPDTKTSPVDCSHHRKQPKVWWQFLKHTHTNRNTQTTQRIPAQQPTQRKPVVRLSKQRR